MMLSAVWVLNTQRSAISDQQSAISFQRSAVSGQLSAFLPGLMMLSAVWVLNTQRSAISVQQSAISCQQSAVSFLAGVDDAFSGLGIHFSLLIFNFQLFAAVDYKLFDMHLLPMEVLRVGRCSLLLFPAESNHTQHLQRHRDAKQSVDIVT